MKLQQAIIDGKFCGLQTVEECYLNASRFLPQIYPYEDVYKEGFELDQEMIAYEAGYLGIDWEFVEAELEKVLQGYNKWCEEQAEKVSEDLFGDFVKT